MVHALYIRKLSLLLASTLARDRCGSQLGIFLPIGAPSDIGNYLRFVSPLTGVLDASHGGLVPLAEVFFRGRILAIVLRNSRICAFRANSKAFASRTLVINFRVSF